MAGTNNSWNNQIAGSYNQIILNAGTNGVAISTDNSAATINVATGGAVKTTTLGSTNSTSATTVQSGSGALAVTSTNGTLTVNSGTGALAISNDSSATTVTIATGGAVKTTTLGSTNTTSATTVQSGSGALNVTATGGALTINSGIGALAISNDASATTLTIGTGGAVKTVTLGSTNTTSVTTIACGTGGCNVGTSANAHATVIGSTTASATTTIQAPSAGVILTGVQGVAVANKNYVTINTATGAIGSDAGASSSITITGDSGGGLTGTSFTFTGGTTGLTFAGAGTTETLGGTLAIANGGTNATSMATSTGIVKYDGTRLVTSSAATINASNVMNNTAQPAFSAVLSDTTNDNNRTGNGTVYTVGTNVAWTELFDQASNFNTNGTFTAPVSGRYQFNLSLVLTGCTINVGANLSLNTTGRTYVSAIRRTATSSDLGINGSFLVAMTSGDTAIMQIAGFGEAADTDDIYSPQTYFSGYLVC